MTNNKQAESFHAGTLTDGWCWFGAHPAKEGGKKGWTFRVWAPHAQGVSVVGDFNNWDQGANPLVRDGEIRMTRYCSRFHRISSFTSSSK